MSVATMPGKVSGTVIAMSRTVGVWSWRLMWLNPLLWPMLILLTLLGWMFEWVCHISRGIARKCGTKDPSLFSDGKLVTEGAAAFFVLLAGLVLQLGELLGSWLQVLGQGSSRSARVRYCEERRAKATAGVDNEDLFHTPPSSPPPFDLVSPSLQDGEEGDEDGDKLPSVADGVTAPTLRERLRNAATAMNVMRRLGVGVLYPPTSSHDANVPKSQQVRKRVVMPLCTGISLDTPTPTHRRTFGWASTEACARTICSRRSSGTTRRCSTAIRRSRRRALSATRRCTRCTSLSCCGIAACSCVVLVRNCWRSLVWCTRCMSARRASALAVYITV